MGGQFAFLAPTRLRTVIEDAREAEGFAGVSARTSALYSRRAMERAVRWMYANDKGLEWPHEDQLAALLNTPSFHKHVSRSLWSRLDLIRRVGNEAAHGDKAIREREAVTCLKALHAFLAWLVRAYAPRGETPPEVPEFDERLLARPAEPAAEDPELIERLKSELVQKEHAHASLVSLLKEKDAKVQELQARIDAITADREANVAEMSEAIAAPPLEAETREVYTDVMLREAGWDPHALNVREFRVQPFPSARGEGKADYVLWDDDARPLAVIEAKRTIVDPRDGRHQAKLYADALEMMTDQRPVVFYTNGYTTWLWDDHFYPPREVHGFYTKDELRLLIQRRSTRRDVSKAKPDPTIADRYYQEEAIKHIMARYGPQNHRKALVVMATGTGKTRVSIAVADVLLKANWVKRVLFLADRTALLRQAKGAFRAFLPHVTTVNLTEGEDEADARIVFSTYHTMMNLIDEARTDGSKRYSVGHFDLIIIDEAHRSVYQKFGAIFEYFDAMLLGLTATPRDEVDRNTYNLFDLDNHMPTYAYELNDAVNDGYLVPFKVLNVPLRFQREGIKYADLTPEEKAEYEAHFYDDEAGTLPGEVSAAAINKWLFNADTVDKALTYLMERGLKVQGGDRLGKTIIFARNHHHALFIEERFDKLFPQYKGSFLRVIDNHITYADKLIDDFYIRDKHPIIAVSVDMLDTGIDVPEILNLVFFKPVRSRVKFWQMIGRGTRLCPDLFGIGQDKQEFYIFDYCGNFDFFERRPEGYDAPPQPSLNERIFASRLSLALNLEGPAKQNEKAKAMRTGLLDELHQRVGSLDADNFLVRLHRQLVEEFSDRARWNRLSEQDVRRLERDLGRLPAEQDEHEMTRRLDLLVHKIQLAALASDPQIEDYQQRLRDLAEALEEKLNIPAVNAQADLIRRIQTDEFWREANLPQLEDARRKLRDLVKFVDKRESQERVYVNFRDEMLDVEERSSSIQPDPRLKNYRLRVERFIRDHEDHPSIQRLKNNEPITQDDIQALEGLLFGEEGPGSRDDYEQTFGADRPLGELIRRITGLDRNAAKNAFSTFVQDRNLTSEQLRFLDLLINHLARNGVVEVEELFEPPFADMHNDGVVGVFGEDAGIIRDTLAKIRDNTSPAT